MKEILAKQNCYDVWFIFFAIEAGIFFTKFSKRYMKHELATTLIYTALALAEFAAFLLSILVVIHGQ